MRCTTRLFSRALMVMGFCLAIFVPALAHAQEGELKVGSKRFTESYILAEVIAQTAQAAGGKTRVLQGLGNTAIVFEALRSGQIDVYGEYTGTIALEIVKGDATMNLAAINQALVPLGLGAAVPLGFNDGYALAMRRAQADELGIKTLSDLAKHPTLKLGLSNEFIGRADGWKGLAARYQLGGQPIGLDHGLAYDAIAQKQIDVMDIYTTDAKIDHLGLLVLQDDQAYFPRYDAVLLYRLDLPQKHPAAWAALQKLEGRINEATMIAMNAQAELASQPFDAIARQFLVQNTAQALAGGQQATLQKVGKTSQSFGAQLWQRLIGDDLWRLTWQHLVLVLVSVGVATLLAVPLGVLLFPHPKLRALALGTAGVLQTIPSLALLAVLIAVLGVIGRWPALLALMVYSVLPILSNTVAGLSEVPPGLRNAALALGMTPGQRMGAIELPIALPTVMAGIRTASAIAIGTATIAAFIGAGGLGERIVTGLALNDSALMLAGALPAAGLALCSELFFEAVDRYLRRSKRI
ncbi:amino acid ABC transporter permease [Rhodoferax koreense]|uniref:Amino acid ABC transporter permease n=1 Tax=Rhodoferax koreensis TaxID=1842727 RepID=A0A1P8JW96_9BURK|nr:glycine betaine ABC transporter substrate-binding protein [Rhodoferax koreense]APW37951.1 amino acid ABC transporter permease [Rhodoferax koreense]